MEERKCSKVERVGHCEMEGENQRLNKMVPDLSLDKDMIEKRMELVEHQEQVLAVGIVCGEPATGLRAAGGSRAESAVREPTQR